MSFFVIFRSPLHKCSYSRAQRTRWLCHEAFSPRWSLESSPVSAQRRQSHPNHSLVSLGVRPLYLLLVQASLNKSDTRAEEYGKINRHIRLHNPRNIGAVVQSTSKNDTGTRWRGIPTTICLASGYAEVM